MNVAKSVVFHGTLIHHLKDLFLAKAKTPWAVERFFEEDPREDFARALAEADVLISMAWNKGLPPAPKLKLIQVPGTGYEGIDFGSVPAGIPELIEQQPDGFVPVDIAAIGVSKDEVLFATRVRGDSMINAHIADGDMAVLAVRRPQYGKIVAALIDGETTLKRYVQKRGRVYLHAENPLFPDLIPARELIIQGVMVALIRKFRK